MRSDMSDKYKNSDISMNAEEKLNILIAEYHSLKTEVEKKGFDEKMQHTLSEMSSEERSRNYCKHSINSPFHSKNVILLL